MVLIIQAARLCVDGGNKPRHAQQLDDDRINGCLAQAAPIGVLQVQVNLSMRLAVNGVTHQVGGVHDRLRPAGNTGAELEWVHQLDDCGTLLVQKALVDDVSVQQHQVQMADVVLGQVIA